MKKSFKRVVSFVLLTVLVLTLGLNAFAAESQTVTLATPVVRITKNDAPMYGVTLSWDAVKGADKYRVYYNDGTNWHKIIDTTKTSYVDTNIRKDGSIYTVKAFSGTNTSSFRRIIYCKEHDWTTKNFKTVTIVDQPAYTKTISKNDEITKKTIPAVTHTEIIKGKVCDWCGIKVSENAILTNRCNGVEFTFSESTKTKYIYKKVSGKAVLVGKTTAKRFTDTSVQDGETNYYFVSYSANLDHTTVHWKKSVYTKVACKSVTISDTYKEDATYVNCAKTNKCLFCGKITAISSIRKK